jgi:hypothetical protein
VTRDHPAIAGLPAVQEIDDSITPLMAVAVVKGLDAAAFMHKLAGGESA